MNIRDLVHDEPLQAVIVASEASELEQDYVCSHLGIDPDMLHWFAAIARTAQALRDADGWIEDWLKRCPDIVLHKFACDCAARACSRAKNVHRESWMAIRAKRRWLRGQISDDALRIAKRAAHRASDKIAAWAADKDAYCASDWAAYRSAYWAADQVSERSWQRERLALLCERFVLGRIRA